MKNKRKMNKMKRVKAVVALNWATPKSHLSTEVHKSNLHDFYRRIFLTIVFPYVAFEKKFETKETQKAKRKDETNEKMKKMKEKMKT